MASTLFDAALAMVQTLVSQFDANKAYYLSPPYQEEARRDFIDKFWTALGWDVNHDRQIGELVYELYGLTQEEIALVEEAK